MGVKGIELKWFESYLTSRYKFVEVVLKTKDRLINVLSKMKAIKIWS